MNAPAFLASSGIISGTGLAIAKIMHFLFIDGIHSAFSAPAADTPINISAPLSISLSYPISLLGLVSNANYTNI
jgi:hypothetical protein